MTEILVGTAFIVALVLLLTAGLLLARKRLLPDGAVRISLNGEPKLEASRGAVLLGVLQDAGVPLPAACGGKGTCGLCRVTVTGDGAGAPRATEKGLLSAAELRSDLRLACQVSLRGAVDVDLPSELLSAESVECRVRSNRMLAPLIRELVLDVPKGHEIAFRAGGFMQLHAPPYRLDFADIDLEEPFREAWRLAGWNRLASGSETPQSRAYSIANRPEDAGTLVFNIRLAVPPPGREGDVPPGVVSSWLFALAPGDSVGAAGPFASFHAQPTEREMVFVGGGVGMAPLRALIHEQIGLGTGRRMTYFYGARSRADLFYADEFETLAAGHETFSWVPALSDPAPGDRWTGETGFIHRTLRKVMSRHPAPEDCEYYLCGPPVMISAVLATLESLGVERSSIFNDDFGA